MACKYSVRLYACLSFGSVSDVPECITSKTRDTDLTSPNKIQTTLFLLNQCLMFRGNMLICFFRVLCEVTDITPTLHANFKVIKSCLQFKKV